MNKRIIIISIACLISCTSLFGGNSKIVTSQDKAFQKSWVNNHILNEDISALPFSFVYGEQQHLSVLKDMKVELSKKSIVNDARQIIRTWTDDNGLKITFKAIVYKDFPAVEWTLYVKNIGTKNTSVIKELNAINMPFQIADGATCKLYGCEGDYCAATSYKPFEISLNDGHLETFAPDMGKSCNGGRGWPYYNVETGGDGFIMAIGWPGEWESSFKEDSKNDVRVKAGQQLFKAYLKPGEEVRTPMICLLFYQNKNRIESQNMWRRFYLSHVIPHFGGRHEQMAMQIQVTPAEKDTSYVKKFIEAGVYPRLCWRDAGWYVTKKGDWGETGTWEIDKKQYPNGFRTYTDWIHRKGMEFVLWFEPERVTYEPCWIRNNHPEWLLPFPKDFGDILNIGNSACLKWLTNHIDSIITTQGIDWYREDMNGSGPMKAWRDNDEKDRQGITENFYIQGHLSLWDELKRRHPNLHIDACASGGRRNDLETMHRAVPLLRSDYQWPDMGEELARGNQCHTWSLSMWLPYQGTGSYLYDSYGARSFYLPSFGMGNLTDENKAQQVKAYKECKQIAPLMIDGDYYPLLPYSLDKDKWIAWQFNSPEKGEGFVQVFRRDNCKESELNLKLFGLKKDKTYVFYDFDTTNKQTFTGRQLMTDGLKINIKEAPGSAILKYKIY